MQHTFWTTLGRLVEAGALPPPQSVIIDPGTKHLNVTVGNREAVNAWVRRLGLDPAIRSGNSFGSLTAREHPGWCGFTTVYVRCRLPLPSFPPQRKEAL